MTRCDKKYWDKFAKTIEIRSKRKKSFSADILSEQMKKFEQEWDFPLPESYRTFAEVFGPVYVSGDYHIMVPAGRKSEFEDMSCRNRERRTSLNDSISAKKKWHPQLMRVITFGSDFCGDTYAWDPLDITDSETHEYGVYCVIRENFRYSPKRIADTFPEFIEDYLLGDGFKKSEPELDSLERYFRCE